MKSKSTPIDELKQSDAYFRYLPETIRIPALDGHRADEVVRPLEDATVDDLAFAILGLEAESRIHQRRLSSLRDLYDQARKRGALGAMTLTEAFAHLGSGEAPK